MKSSSLHNELCKDRFLVCSLIVIGLFGGLLAVVQAKIFADIVDGAFLGGLDMSQLQASILCLILAAFCRALFLWLGGIIGGNLAMKVKIELRQRLLKKLYVLGPAYAEREQTGELLHTLTEGIESLDPYFSKYLPQLASAALVPPVILAVVFSADGVVAVIMLVTAPLIPLFMILIGRWAKRLHQRQWGALSLLGGHFFDVLKGLPTLKIYNRSKEQAAVISRLSGQFRDTALSVLKVAFLSALALELLSTLSVALVAVVVALKLLQGGILFHQAFFILLLAPEYYLPLRMLGSHFHAGLSSQTAAKRIFDILELAENRAEKMDCLPFPQTKEIALECKNVCFAYYKERQSVLHSVSFQIAAGERLALVGPSGAGKSTIVDLLLGFIMPDEGGIFINGQKLENLKRTDWLEHVAYVSQFPHLFYGTIGDNIRFGMAGSADKMEMAARQAGAHEFIQGLPDGYNTLIGDDGAGLSGGEKQRIAIARAFYREAPFLIVDEAATGLDPRSEEIVRESLYHLMAGKTVLIIAHRLSTACQADRILVLDQGKIVENGCHRELCEKRGLYYRMTAAYQGDL